jgi:hypothetical protein
VGTDISPHGGYSASTGYCLQCHSVHNAGGAYALMYEQSVTDTCNTCHGLNGSATGTGANNVTIGTQQLATASSRDVYYVSTPAASHTIGATSVPDSNGVTITEGGWSYHMSFPHASSTTPAGAGTSAAGVGGLYCASCHTPHGTYGQAVNTWSTKLSGSNFTGVRTVADAVTTSGSFTITSATASFASSDIGSSVAGAIDGGGAIAIPPDDTIASVQSTTQATLAMAASASETGYTMTITSNDENREVNVTGDQNSGDSWTGYNGSGGSYTAWLHDYNGSWVLCATSPTPTSDTTQCTSPATPVVFNAIQVKDSKGQLVSLAGYKLLSKYPNHQYASPKTYNLTAHNHDEANWCATCHNQNLDSSMTSGTGYHDHPTGCDACHGNPNPTDAEGGTHTDLDYPHTSSMVNFLKDYPDALCESCHASGTLP